MIDKQNFLTYLKKHYPHLYKVQSLVEQINTGSKHGNVFIDLRIKNGVVDKSNITWSENEFLILRKDNKLTE